ncbi:bcl-2-related ovarian killer protein homolog B-like [Amphibalanus amphitrite]|uniref:bcl-2-related ovarian killer protein homolog B-like n=1 Tax=Amphibalanus amphitrite TaxID=1232801 RepID=UPI001C927B6B|nr:bcl-2-related ovarian killer protein homolog B-like [Amphibalanus amphitrite]XP_043229309.1 bcl-2-related ovarian killer protein homolog B-like [Amphibalanus amphitrite]
MSRTAAPPLDKTDSFEKLDKFTSLEVSFPQRQLLRHSRKSSFPAAFHSSAQEVRPRRKSSHVVPSSDRVAVPRSRKFSNVSDVVARKLSTTIGWRTHNIQEIVHQSKSLGSQYVRARLKRSGVFHRKLGLQRLSSLASLHGGAEICDVFREMVLIGVELERMHPSVYTAISRQVNMAITSDKTVRAVVNSVAVDLFRSEVTWGRIIALYSVAGGLAVECVKLGHPEYLLGLIESLGMVAERDTGQWIASQGGWGALLTRFRPPNTDPSIGGILVTGGAGLLAVAIFLMVLLRSLGRVISDLRESTS